MVSRYFPRFPFPAHDITGKDFVQGQRLRGVERAGQELMWADSVIWHGWSPERAAAGEPPSPPPGSSNQRSHDLVIPLLGADDKESKTGVQTNTAHTFRAARPTAARRWRQPK